MTTKTTALLLILCTATSCSLAQVFRVSDDDPELLEAQEDEIPVTLSPAEQNCTRLRGTCGGLKCVADHDCSGAQRCVRSMCMAAPARESELLEGAQEFEEGLEKPP